MTFTESSIVNATRKDCTLSLILDHVLNGWPSFLDKTVNDDTKVFFQRRNELSSENGCCYLER